tara:strand:+ start:35 stop:373 length:339 start_codon:yes stop_codon:yes gene_type:complete
MHQSKINWTQLAKIAPNNPATGRDYRGQSLKRVAEGLRENVMLYKWLQGNGISCAKTKEGRIRSGRSKPRQKARTEVSALCYGKKSQLSEITKAICGETYSYPTDHDRSKGD